MHIGRKGASKVPVRRERGRTGETRRTMIVCLCNALRETQVRDVARDGVRCALEAYQRLGCRPRCGQCLPFAREILRSADAPPPA